MSGTSSHQRRPPRRPVLGLSGGPGGSDGLGHGLVGIGERVKIYGGQMSAGAGENGGFVLRARLPQEGLGA